MTTLFVALGVAALGAALHMLGKNARLVELGRMAFAVGLLAALSLPPFAALHGLESLEKTRQPPALPAPPSAQVTLGRAPKSATAVSSELPSELPSPLPTPQATSRAFEEDAPDAI